MLEKYGPYVFCLDVAATLLVTACLVERSNQTLLIWLAFVWVTGMLAAVSIGLIIARDPNHRLAFMKRGQCSKEE